MTLRCEMGDGWNLWEYRILVLRQNISVNCALLSIDQHLNSLSSWLDPWPVKYHGMQLGCLMESNSS